MAFKYFQCSKRCRWKQLIRMRDDISESFFCLNVTLKKRIKCGINKFSVIFRQRVWHSTWILLTNCFGIERNDSTNVSLTTWSPLSTRSSMRLSSRTKKFVLLKSLKWVWVNERFLFKNEKVLSFSLLQ